MGSSTSSVDAGWLSKDTGVEDGPILVFAEVADGSVEPAVSDKMEPRAEDGLGLGITESDEDVIMMLLLLLSSACVVEGTLAVEAEVYKAGAVDKTCVEDIAELVEL